MNCRSCGGDAFGDVIDLDRMPLVNNLLDDPDEHCPTWPLKVVFCLKCSLAQLTETPPPEAMFDEYLYFSSQSQTMVAHAGGLVQRFVRRGQRVIEIASNDGYLLQQAKERGAAVLGVDPARNIAAWANEHGVPTRADYFNAPVAREIRDDWGGADVLFANNVLAHVPDPNEVIAGIKVVLAEDGIGHIEVPSLVSMIDAGAFDTIYHEHQCYFSLTALKPLINRHHLKIVAVELTPIHGGSFHLQVAHEGDESQADSVIENERRWGVLDRDRYARFAQRVKKTELDLKQAASRFQTVAAYGAAAKGVVLLNRFGLDATSIPWVADVSPYKQGKFLPGTRQPVVHPDELLGRSPEAALLLPWNIRDEVIGRNTAYIDQGGRFIVPIPEVRIFPNFS